MATRLTAHFAVIGLAASVLPPPVMAQNRDIRPAPPSVVVAEPQPETRMDRSARAAYAEQIKKRGVFGVFLSGLDDAQRAIACGTIADYLADGAAAAADPAERAARLVPAWRLGQRVAAPRAQALQELSKRDIARFQTEFGQIMTMASTIPDPAIAKADLDTSETGFLFQFASVLAARCHESLDANGVPDVSSQPTAEFIDLHTRFRFRGLDSAAAFAGTDLAPFADTICRGRTAFDFTAAPLAQRGHEGMSLLDWAVECEDRAAFDALIAAGFDLEAPGLWGDPPVVSSAAEKRLWYLTRLLDAGAKPDAAGRSEVALVAATSDLDAVNSGGDTKAAFNLLRARGASLNFPNFGGSMWNRWGLQRYDGGWARIIEHWDEFDSDPVELASLAETVIAGKFAWMEGQQSDAAKVKALLESRYGVCFPVGRTLGMAKDARGFLIQPDCPGRP